MAVLPFRACTLATCSRCIRDWLDRVTALDAALITRTFALPESVKHAAARRDALAAYEGLTREIANLRAQAQKETQMNRRVELNLAIKHLEAELTRTTGDL